MESKIGRGYINKMKYSLIGAIAVTAGLITPHEVLAQSQNTNDQPVVIPEVPFVKPGVSQLSNREKPLVSAVFAPRVLVDLSDPDQIISDAAFFMSTTQRHVRDIIMCESSGDQNKVNPKSGASGWWQIMPNTDNITAFANLGWDYWRDRFNPYRNTRVAIMIWNKLGWGAWDCK